MEDLNIKELGAQLHETETVIGLGKQAVKDLSSESPISEDDINIQRQQIHEARIVRNELRAQLATGKRTDLPLPKYRWC